MSAFAMFATKEPSLLSFEDLLGAKPGDHQHLFEQVIANMDEDNCRTETQQVASAKQKHGHGKQNLTTVLALLMFLAFAVDQIQEACCGLFNAAVERAGRRIRLWKSIRSHLRHFEFGSFVDLFLAIASGRLCKPPQVS